ncbi:MAG: hypothetical protein ACK5LJ_02545 [Paracoccus sp. (in: a-proteobacteria)]
MRLIGAAALAGALFGATAAAAEVIALTMRDASVGVGMDGQSVIGFTLDPTSSRRFGEFTSGRVERQVFFHVGNRLMAAPVIGDPILSGTGQLLIPDAPGEEKPDAQRVIDDLLSGVQIVVSDERIQPPPR